MKWDVCHYFTGQVYCEGSYEECEQYLEENSKWFKVLWTDHDYKTICVDLLDPIQWKPFVASTN